MTLYISSVQTKIGFIVHDDRLSVGGRGSDMWGIFRIFIAIILTGCVRDITS